MSNSRFTIFQSPKNQQFYFNLKAGNGEIILASEGYKQKSSAEAAVSLVRTCSQSDDNYDRKETPAGFSFNLKASNGEIIGRSEVYKAAAGRENGIASVKRNAPVASLVDETV